MPIKFNPKFSITPRIAGLLLRIESAKEKVKHLPLTPSVLASLRETARLYITHYSTMIEGNRLQPDEILEVLNENRHFSGKDRDEKEVKGYYAALRQIEQWTQSITENLIKTIHAWVMSGGKVKVKPTPYRDGQNVIRDSRSKTIVYMPPEAKDVPRLMKELVQWIANNKEIPNPILAAIAHYQFATIHPYYDGNGRTARLLTTLILHLGGYGLKGLYSLEEYYAQNLPAYYEAISVGPSHNYYIGRAEADITKWVEYFIEGMAAAFEKVLQKMIFARQEGKLDLGDAIRELDPKQRLALELFAKFEVVTSAQVATLFRYKARSAALLCKSWVESGFLEIVDPSNKGRKYRLAKKYHSLLV